MGFNSRFKGLKKVLHVDCIDYLILCKGRKISKFVKMSTLDKRSERGPKEID